MRKRMDVLVDDFDGVTPAAETVRFTVDGTRFEMDLSEANAAEFREYLAPYVAVARRPRGDGARTKPKGPTETEIRAWAKANDIPINTHGRVPASVRAAFLSR